MLASRLFLLCEGCGVCRQHLLTLPKNAQANALSAARCNTCGNTVWLRLKTSGNNSVGTRPEKKADSQNRKGAAPPPSAASDPPRTAALKAYARRAIANRTRVLSDPTKGSAPLNVREISAQAGARHELQLANKRLDDYDPPLGLEHCPKCFVFGSANVPLLQRSDPGVSGCKLVIVTCTSCGFIGSIPSGDDTGTRDFPLIP
jgi:hypothetical protein